MATEPRVPSAVAGQPATFGTVMSHAPDVIGSFFALYAEFWQQGIVPVDVKEMTRVRNARVTDCGYWRNVRFDSARAAGLDEEKVSRIDDGYAEVLAPHEVAALRLTDALVGVPQLPDEATRAALREHFSEAQVVELALGVGLFMGMSKVLITLGLEPETMPVTVLPTPGSA